MNKLMDVQKYKWFETEKTQVQNGISCTKAHDAKPRFKT